MRRMKTEWELVNFGEGDSEEDFFLLDKPINTILEPGEYLVVITDTYAYTRQLHYVILPGMINWTLASPIVDEFPGILIDLDIIDSGKEMWFTAEPGPEPFRGQPVYIYKKS